MVPEGNWAEQVAPQLMPAGELVTHPVPLPAIEIVSVTGAELDATDCSAWPPDAVVGERISATNAAAAITDTTRRSSDLRCIAT